jgi:hypothetical protein
VGEAVLRRVSVGRQLFGYFGWRKRGLKSALSKQVWAMIDVTTPVVTQPCKLLTRNAVMRV